MPRRASRQRWAVTLAALLLAAGFAWLGVWQIERRAWKHDLIARVDRRVAALPVDAPGPARWPQVTRERDEYRRVSLTGRFLPGRDTFVTASTVLGPGYWLLSPFAERRGFTVIVNRGFVPDRRRVPTSPSPNVTGLLRISEPGGDLLRSNDPAAALWYSRDVPAIAAAHGVVAAPYFVDAAGEPQDPPFPRGGLTVIAFSDNHLIYATTWFALAALTMGVATAWLRRPRPD